MLSEKEFILAWWEKISLNEKIILYKKYYPNEKLPAYPSLWYVENIFQSENYKPEIVDEVSNENILYDTFKSIVDWHIDNHDISFINDELLNDAKKVLIYCKPKMK